MKAFPIGKAEVVRRGEDVAILAFGASLEPATQVAERLGASLVNMRFVKPLDGDVIEEMARSHELLVTVEENAASGGAGSGVTEFLVAAGTKQNGLRHGCNLSIRGV